MKSMNKMQNYDFLPYEDECEIDKNCMICASLFCVGYFITCSIGLYAAFHYC